MLSDSGKLKLEISEKHAMRIRGEDKKTTPPKKVEGNDDETGWK